MKNQAGKNSLALFAAIAFSLAASAQQPVKLQMAPGETKTLTRDKVTSATEAFLVHATTGQALLVEMKMVGRLQEPDGNDRVQVFAPGSSQQMPSNMDTDEAAMHWLNTLSQAGNYKIVVKRPSKKPYTLAVTLIDANDPRLDPGMSPDQVHLDLSGLGIQKPLSLLPFVPTISDEMIEPWPAHLGVVTDHLEIHILSISGIRKAYGSGSGFSKQFEKFQAAIQNKKPFPAKDLPLSPYEDSAVDLPMRQETLEGKSFQGIRWIASFSQDGPSAPTNPLSYIFEGVSRDGRYFLVIRGDITHPSLTSSDQLPKDLWQPGPKVVARRKEVLQNIGKAAPETFTPDLGKLDAIVQSLQLP